MSSNQDNYNDALIDKMMAMRSLPNYADLAMRYVAESELSPGQEELFLRKAQVFASLEMARIMNLWHQRPN